MKYTIDRNTEHQGQWNVLADGKVIETCATIGEAFARKCELQEAARKPRKPRKPAERQAKNGFGWSQSRIPRGC
jgi:hypothetical protein